VDLLYLESRGASLTWITKPAVEPPRDWPVTDLVFAENELSGEDKEEEDGPGGYSET
jgi:hypothetical protein